MDNKSNFVNKRIFLLIALILGVMVIVTSSTYAYLFYSANVDNVIGGDMASVNLELDVDMVLPVSDTVKPTLLFGFSELADNLNNGCIDEDGDYALCQLYKINLKNNSGGVNTDIKGSLRFENATLPNLSWILLDGEYNSSIDYTSDMLGDSFNTASSTYNSFVDNYLLTSGNEVTYYILVWINEIDEIQYDSGSYTGVVKFEDSNGEGVTAEFGS